jgi:hypothetical protein
MAITNVKRDWGDVVSLVRMQSNDTIATVLSAGYVTAQSENIISATGGGFLWNKTDAVLIKASNGWILASISSDFSSLTTFSSSMNMTGDTGSASGSSIQIEGGGIAGAGASVLFAASGSTISFNVTDSNFNTIVGKGSGGTGSSGSSSNTIFGSYSFSAPSNNSATDNCSLGNDNLVTCLGSLNVAIGSGVFPTLTLGNYNIGIGPGAGSNYTGSESNNILISSPGVQGESNKIRIGFTNGSSSHNEFFADGISGVTGSSSPSVLITSSGQLIQQAPASTVTQQTSITTAVTLNSNAGIITTVSASLAPNSSTSFSLLNNVITSSSLLKFFLVGYSGALVVNGIPSVFGSLPSVGSCTVNIINVSEMNALSGTIEIGYEIH